MKRVVLLVAATLLLAPTAALADGIDFTFVGGSATATSTTISGSSNLSVIARIPSPPGPSYNSVSGTVSFTSGTWGTTSFLPGGSLTVTYTGGLPSSSGLTAGDILVSSGTFTTTQTWTVTLINSTMASATFSGAVSANVNPILYSFLGLPNVNPAQGYMITLIIFFDLNNCTATSCTGAISSGNLFLAPVPEPGTLALFGTGLVGLAGMIRRRMSK